MKVPPALAALFAIAIPLSGRQSTPPPPPKTGHVYSEARASNQGPHVSGKFGDLAVAVTALVAGPNRLEQGRPQLMAIVAAVNTGNAPICANLSATLQTSLGNYHADTVRAPQMQEMSPRAVSGGSYLFETKPGAKPLAIVFSIGSARSIRCGTPEYDGLIPQQVRLDIQKLPIRSR